MEFSASFTDLPAEGSGANGTNGANGVVSTSSTLSVGGGTSGIGVPAEMSGGLGRGHMIGSPGSSSPFGIGMEGVGDEEERSVGDYSSRGSAHSGRGGRECSLDAIMDHARQKDAPEISEKPVNGEIFQGIFDAEDMLLDVLDECGTFVERLGETDGPGSISSVEKTLQMIAEVKKRLFMIIDEAPQYPITGSGGSSSAASRDFSANAYIQQHVADAWDRYSKHLLTVITQHVESTKHFTKDEKEVQ
eukprot:TRINITY_DN6358_c1_g1_i1.p1 TRINITY_DN6358_c1_g1~~TRINITY_DN6358_c1_g1_i1.p1  ORF type:complete len:247 (+),score=73.07 TRINITY_DN6358_c1_g1_i1:109-849(+)